MMSERRPFEILDDNRPVGFKRVQPSRAAKTSHKWLSSRNDKEKVFKNENAGISRENEFGCAYIGMEGHDKEHICQPEIKSSFGRVKQAVKSKSEQAAVKDTSHNRRLPLHALSLPSIKPAFFRSHSTVNEKDDKVRHERSYFPPLLISPDQSDTSMSVSLDTISETSLQDFEDSDDYKNNDSAFFSSTQSSLPFVDSQDAKNDSESQTFGLAKPPTCRPTTTANRDLDVVDEYFPEILAYMRDAEARYRPRADSIQRQPEITSTMRTKLVDWLIEVQDEYKLENETVSLAVAYSDRFLSMMSVSRAKLQLLGTTAMFVAAKYEEIYPPDADEFAYVTADTYTKDEVILMERLLLRALGTNLAVPTANQFLGLLLHKSNARDQFRTLATYLTEITMLYDSYQQYSYSILAAAAISVANHLSGHPGKISSGEGTDKYFTNARTCEISPTVRAYMEDCHDQIYVCALELLLSHHSISSAPQQFVREKYSSKKNFKVALISSVKLDSQDVVASAVCTRKSLLSVWITSKNE